MWEYIKREFALLFGQALGDSGVRHAVVHGGCEASNTA